jgi:DNA-binding GntR family transcriptional regulator
MCRVLAEGFRIAVNSRAALVAAQPTMERAAMFTPLPEEATTTDDRRQSLTDRSYALIKSDIIRCVLPPGEAVTEEQLARRYDVGRPAARAAVQRLTQEQLIEVSGKRYIIAPVTLKDVQDLYAVRLVLEPLAARDAAGRLTPGQLQRLTELLDVHYELGDRQSLAAYASGCTEFHVLIAQAAGNGFLTEIVGRINDRLERLNHLSHMRRNRSEATRDWHRELVDALAVGDAERAQQVMAGHIIDSRDYVITALLNSPSVQSVHITG